MINNDATSSLDLEKQPEAAAESLPTMQEAVQAGIVVGVGTVIALGIIGLARVSWEFATSLPRRRAEKKAHEAEKNEESK